MFDVKETNLSWKFYRRFHDCGATDLPPHPKNLCRYFWSCIFGMIWWFFADAPAWFGAILLGIAYLTHPPFEREKLGVVGFFWCLAWAVLVAFSMFYVGKRFQDWVNKQSATVQTFCIGGFFLGFFSLLFSVGYITPENPYSIWHILYGFLSVLGTTAGMAVIVLLWTGLMTVCKKDSLIKSYLIALKQQVCPLIQVSPEMIEMPEQKSSAETTATTTEINAETLQDKSSST